MCWPAARLARSVAESSSEPGRDRERATDAALGSQISVSRRAKRSAWRGWRRLSSQGGGRECAAWRPDMVDEDEDGLGSVRSMVRSARSVVRRMWKCPLRRRR